MIWRHLTVVSIPSTSSYHTYSMTVEIDTRVESIFCNCTEKPKNKERVAIRTRCRISEHSRSTYFALRRLGELSMYDTVDRLAQPFSACS
jgi:hypothetical protein